MKWLMAMVCCTAEDIIDLTGRRLPSPQTSSIPRCTEPCDVVAPPCSRKKVSAWPVSGPGNQPQPCPPQRRVGGKSRGRTCGCSLFGTLVLLSEILSAQSRRPRWSSIGVGEVSVRSPHSPLQFGPTLRCSPAVPDCSCSVLPRRAVCEGKPGRSRHVKQS